MSDDEAAAKKAAGAKKKKLMMMVAAVVAVAVGGYLFMGSSSASTEKEAPVLGEVVLADAMHINLADGHFLKLQIALQVIEGPAHAPDPSLALDAAIDLFSGQEIDYVSSYEGRKKLKKKLVEKADKLYHHEVVDIYFTQYVVQ